MTDSYRINEGVFPLPGNEEWQDSTLNIFRNARTGTSLMISRAPIPPEKSFEQELDHQWSLLETVVEQLESTPRRPVFLPQSPDINAVEIDCHFRRGAQKVYQRQLAIHLAASRQMLIFTCSTSQPFSDEDTHYWQKLCRELSLTQ